MYLDMYPEVLDALPGKGSLNAKLMLIGMAPSPNRPYERRLEPFGAKSWDILRGIVNMIGEENLYVTNLVKTPIPAGEKLGAKRIKLWKPGLLEEINRVAPKRILCLGDEVGKALIPGFGGLRSDHGTFFNGED